MSVARNGFICMAESVIGTYPVSLVPNSVAPVKVYQTSPSDAGNLKVFNSITDLFLGNSALTYSEKGYGYAMEKAGSTKGWTFTIFEEAFNQGYPQELRHFIACVREDQPPLVTGEDGRAVLEIMNAAYHSARTGQKVSLPFRPKVNKPIDLWLR